MKINLKIGAANVRGIAGETFTPELLISFAQAFGTYLGPGTVAVGRDTRISGEMASEAVLAGLTSVGCDVVDAGVCPLPVIRHFVAKSEAIGGIAITASHDPEQWNALKFLREDGTCLNSYQADELLDLYHRREFNMVSWNRLGRLNARDDLFEPYAEDLRGLIDVDAIRAARFRVAVDCCHGAGGPIAPGFLRSLGCEATALYAVPNGRFPREPEPIPANLGELRRTVREKEAQAGFAQDVDGGRLAVVTEEGTAASGDYTFVLAALSVLRKHKGPIVADISTSRALDDLGALYGCPVHRSKAGEAGLVEKIRSTGAIVGGEGSGGVILPAFHLGCDSFIGMGLILELMAGASKKLSQLLAEDPPYEIDRTSIPCPTDHIYRVLADTRARYQHERLSLIDGVKVDWPDRWVLVRPSSTEPALRVAAEAPTREEAMSLCDEIRALAEQVIGTVC